MRVEVIDRIEGLEAVASEWDSVLSSSTADTIFLTSDWLISWWKGYRPEARLMCLAVRDQEGKALGFAPLYITRKKKAGISYKALLFLGDGTHETEYMDFFCKEGEENAVFPHILNWLSKHGDLWDVCEWNVMPENSASLSFIRTWGLETDSFLSSEPYECSRVELNEDYEDYLNSLSRNHRRHVRNLCNRAEKKGQARYMALDEPDLLDEGLNNLYDLHTRRWNSVGQSGSFTDPGRLRFYKDMTARFREKGWLRLRRLDLLGQPAAVQIGFLRNGIYSFLQEGFDPGLGPYRPGTVLRARVIQELIGEGAGVYDFLGYPTPAKERWNTKLMHCCCLKTARNGLKIQVILKVPQIIRRIRNRISARHDRVRGG